MTFINQIICRVLHLKIKNHTFKDMSKMTARFKMIIKAIKSNLRTLSIVLLLFQKTYPQESYTI